MLLDMMMQGSPHANAARAACARDSADVRRMFDAEWSANESRRKEQELSMTIERLRAQNETLRCSISAMLAQQEAYAEPAKRDAAVQTCSPETLDGNPPEAWELV